MKASVGMLLKNTSEVRTHRKVFRGAQTQSSLSYFDWVEVLQARPQLTSAQLRHQEENKEVFRSKCIKHNSKTLQYFVLEHTLNVCGFSVYLLQLK